MKEFYTAKDLIEILDFSKNTIYKYLEEGKIKSSRVGKGGYRVPRAEVEKWLGEGKGELADGSTEAGEMERVEKRMIREEKDSSFWMELANTGRSRVDLFDWLIFLLTMMISLSFFLLPGHLYQIKFKEVLWLAYLFRAVFLMSGLLYLMIKIKGNRQKKWCPVMNFWLAGMFFVLAMANLWVGKNYGIALYLSVFLVLLMKGFKKRTKPVIYFVWLLFIASWGMDLMLALGRGQIMTILIDKWYLWILIFFIPLWGLIFSLRSIKGERKLLKWILFIQGGVFLWLAMRLVGLGIWDGVFAYIVVGVMAFLLPFEEMFVMKVGRKKGFAQVFIYIGAVLVIGILVMVITRNVFRSMARKDLLERSEIVMVATKDFFDQSKKEMAVLTKSELLHDLMRDEKKESIDELVKGIVGFSRGIERVGIYDKEGVMITIYPHTTPDITGVDFSLREYFKKAKAGEVYVSDLFRAKMAGSPWAMMVSAPVYNKEGEFIGVVSGCLDMDRLRDVVKVQQKTEEGSVVVFDSNGRVLVDTSGEWLYEKVGNKYKESLFEGVVVETFDEDWSWENGESLELGIYREVGDYGHGVVLEESAEELEKRMVEALLPIIGAMMIVLFGGLGWILEGKNMEGLGKKGIKIGKNWEKRRK